MSSKNRCKNIFEYGRLNYKIMDIKTKKIVAREVLYLFYVNALLFILWGFLELRIFYFTNIIENKSAVSYTTKSELKQRLRKFVAVANKGEYLTEGELLDQFPDLKAFGDEVLKDFVATSNSENYKTENVLFLKFPEFYDDVSKRKYQKSQQEINDDRCKLNSNSNFIEVYLPIFAFVLYCLLYPIRLLFYLLKWSFRILREHN